MTFLVGCMLACVTWNVYTTHIRVPFSVFVRVFEDTTPIHRGEARARASAYPNKMVEAQLVTLETFFVNKRRLERIGIELQGAAHPRVVATRESHFRVDDVVYVINGHLCHGAKRTAWRIRWNTHLSITVWRQV